MNKGFFQTAVAVISLVSLFGQAQQSTSGAGVLVANNANIITQIPHIALEDLLAFGGEDALLAAWRAKTVQVGKVQIQEIKAPTQFSSAMIDSQALSDAAVLLEGDAALIGQMQHIALDDLLEFGGQEPLLLAWYGKMVMGLK